MIRVDGMAPERFIDHCRRCGIPLWFVKRVSRVSISACLPFSALAKAEQAAKAARCNLVVEQPSRSVRFRQSLFKRKALLLSLTAAVLLMGAASRFVWGVNVTGAITPQMKENVFQTLEELSIMRGTRWAMIDSAAIENRLRLNTQGVQMAIVHRNGLFLELEIIPAVEPPEWETDQTACDIVSMRSAVIESVIALEGTPMVKPGDRVLPGDMLIRGTYRRGEEEGKQRFVRAKGSVMGRVSYAGQAGAALQYQSFITSGRTAVVRTLVLGSLRIPLSPR
ncbi:MAG: sporulation protein YqfD, partial [Clostridia bacterium]|nr:sporulation protein YqfD [Clostridia bacterium]